MKVLIINVVYNKGSTGKIVKELFDAYSILGHEVMVIYGRGKKQNNPRIIKGTFEFESKMHHLSSKIFGNYLGGMFFSTSRIISKIKKFNPDLVHIHLLNGYFVNAYRLLNYLQKFKKKTILTMHAENMMTGGCGYAVSCTKYLTNYCLDCEQKSQIDGFFANKSHKNLMKLATTIKRFDKNDFVVTCVSPWLAERYKQSFIYKDFRVVSVLNPIPDLFFETPSSNPYKTDKNVLFVTSNFNDINKCGYYIFDLCKRMPDYNFYVIDSKHNCSNGKQHRNLFFINDCVNQEKLRDYYCYAKCTVLFSKRETFSMVIAESLTCKTPVVAFKNGGSESFAKVGATFVEFGDIGSMVSAVAKCNQLKALDATQNFNKLKIAKDYLSLFEVSSDEFF